MEESPRTPFCRSVQWETDTSLRESQGKPRAASPLVRPRAPPHVFSNACWLRATMGAEARRPWLPASTAQAAASRKIATLGRCSGSHGAPKLKAQQA
jgi:hypothetical protein